MSSTGKHSAAAFCAAPGCTRPLPPGRRRFCSDLCQRRGRRRQYDNDEFGAMVIRMIRSLTRRVGAADIDTFGALWDVQTAADNACVEAIDELRGRGYSWADLAAQVGMTKQGMSQWHKRRVGQAAVNEPFTRESAS